MQQSRYFTSLRDFTCTRRALLRDLQNEIGSWSALLGDRISLAGDFNEPVDHAHLSQFLASLGLVNILHARHPAGQPISTHARGSTIIDAVWASPELSLAAGSWLSFSTSVGDHRSLVLDLDCNLLLGSPTIQVASPLGRRLNSHLPIVRSTYIQLLEKFLYRSSFFHKVQTLCQRDWSAYPPSDFHQHLELSDRLRSEGMRFAEQRSRKFHAGAVFFSPSVNAARQLRSLYHLVLQRLGGRRISRSRITKLAKKCNILDACGLTLQEARQRY